ncbi:RNA pseudouridine synthase 1 [Syzygium oleosum]|uniref:RNA pseudouridine synthase 1 n=1 Tax=Syzygium oleosum TaxID=219896 RepID=UPI0024BB7591|nr:RNA pseudouridine synthase 1 [Syzygium oleosum]
MRFSLSIPTAATAKPFFSDLSPRLRRAAAMPPPHPVPPDASGSPISYPVPLSPPLPPLSKQVELDRAMSASSRSSAFSLSRNHVVYEDEWLLAVDKPPGVYCESVLASAPRLVLGDSVDSGCTEAVPELHLANRLDRDTSGIMLITKSHKVASRLVKAFTEHKVRKTYIALCVGLAPKWETISIQSGHGRSKFGAWRVYATADVGRTLPGGSVVRDMKTSFEVLTVNGQLKSKHPVKQGKDNENIIVVEEKSSIRDNGTKDVVFVRAYPRSGRTHQIRLHCQYLGIPIRGDVKYEGVYEWEGQIYDYHTLHAESLSFEHPVTGVPLMFRAPLPAWAAECCPNEIPPTFSSNEIHIG